MFSAGFFNALLSRSGERRLFEVSRIRGYSVKRRVRATVIIKIEIVGQRLPDLGYLVVAVQVNFSYLTDFEGRSTKRLSRQQPLPFILT